MESHYPGLWSETAFVCGFCLKTLSYVTLILSRVCVQSTCIWSSSHHITRWMKMKTAQCGLFFKFLYHINNAWTINTVLYFSPDASSHPTLFGLNMATAAADRLFVLWHNALIKMRCVAHAAEITVALLSDGPIHFLHIVPEGLHSSLTWRNIILRSSERTPTHLSVSLLWFDHALLSV